MRNCPLRCAQCSRQTNLRQPGCLTDASDLFPKQKFIARFGRSRFVFGLTLLFRFEILPVFFTLFKTLFKRQRHFFFHSIYSFIRAKAISISFAGILSDFFWKPCKSTIRLST